MDILMIAGFSVSSVVGEAMSVTRVHPLTGQPYRAGPKAGETTSPPERPQG